MYPRTILAIGASIAVTTATAQLHERTPPKQTYSAAEWPTYNNGYSGQRFSALTQITAKNVGSLRDVCRLKVADGGSFYSGPVVVDGTMYLTTLRDTFAVDPVNCQVRWKATYEPEQEVPSVASNRGVAVMDGRVFRGTGDARLLALSARTGEVIWKNVVGNAALDEFIPGVPIAWNGLVIAGVAGGDFGIRGRIVAYDAISGREVWRFYTIPTGNETGADTWEIPETAEIGGGGTWSTFALDVINGELFVPVGDAAPSFTPQARPGANLFSNSMVVLDALTGTLKWWHQLSPNDGRDLDLAAAPMLYLNSKGRHIVAVAGKDGYVRGIDRLTQRVLFKTPVTTIENEGVRPSEKETKFCPGGVGGTEWNGPALDRARQTLFVGAVDWCMLVKATGEERFVRTPGKMLWGATVTMVNDPPPSGWVSALDSDTGKVKWKYHAEAPVIAAVTPTAGGIVLTGDIAGNLIALDSATGRILYKKNTGGEMAGGIITYAIDGKQYVAYATGSVSRISVGIAGAPTLVIMALDGKASSAASSSSRGSSSTPGGGAVPSLQGASDIERGQALYEQNCAVCHGARGEGGTGKSLIDVKDRLSFDSTLQWLKDPKPPMPKLFPSPLGEQDIRDVAAFIRQF